ncbi:hypothetical protein SNEBB_001586 [Seison nebaliae]|nr:hypothetical protein SNEBB_001586 [Seison nebaliae]
MFPESLWNWINKTLFDLGLWNKSGKLVFLGLDNAGKTTLLRMLRDGKISQPVPTFQPTSEELKLGNIKFTTYDLGGHKQVRKVWKNYFPVVDAIVFLVDISDRSRIIEARSELQSLISDEQVSQCPILVLGNKMDEPTAISEMELKYYLGLLGTCTGKENVLRTELASRPVELYLCSIYNQEGYGEGFRWLSEFL